MCPVEHIPIDAESKLPTKPVKRNQGKEQLISIWTISSCKQGIPVVLYRLRVTGTVFPG